MPIKKGPVHPLNLYVISDSTANLVRHMLAAFLTQFPPGTFHVRQMSFVQGVDDLDHAFTLIAAAPGPVAHAVILPALKQAIGKRCKVMKLLCHDLTGPTVEFLAKAAGIEPLVDTSRLHLVDAEYQRRIDAMEYTLNHDDGLGIATLAEADVVLVGVSRVSKTPTGILLAQRGLRAANVALAMEVEPPAELLAMPPKKVIGLTIEPVQLAEIRSRRQEEWGMQTTRYNERQHVAREVAWARKLFAQHRWRTLDVTDQAVEETAARIVQLLEGSES